MLGFERFCREVSRIQGNRRRTDGPPFLKSLPLASSRFADLIRSLAEKLIQQFAALRLLLRVLSTGRAPAGVLSVLLLAILFVLSCGSVIGIL